MKSFIFPKTEFLREAHENQSQHERFTGATAGTYERV